MKTTTSIIYPAFALFAFGWLAFLPQMHAAPNAYGGPPADGCYPGFTTAEGCSALANLTTGAGNTGLGWYSLFFAGGSSFNTGVGAGALVLNGGDSNTAVGAAALLLNTEGTLNTALGTNAMVNNGIGSNNTALGAFALSNNTDGDHIIALGVNAGTEPGVASNNLYLGDMGFAGDQNVIAIGGIAASGTPYDMAFIGAVYGGVVSAQAVPVLIDSDGHLGTSIMDTPGTKLRLRGPQHSQPQAMVGEIQKQQNRITELENTVARLVATVKEQAAQIQKVSAQIELSKAAPQTVLNNH